MNLSKINDKEKLRICRIYYLAGYAFLPFLWLVNFVWFFKYAFLSKPFPEQAQIRRYLIKSAIGVAIWTIIIVSWNIIFQLNRIEWGALGDYLTFIIPRGRP